ncbi:splicing factor, putative [Plasmodium ovale wallikeri]|uniref:H/ACA ribonucleoprotein complex subunit 2 n=1 Tax=Plasmodium ovale wallikeri TaxID=864142 RepID=A0A1A8YUT7_PLAOA|nr:splicing factor, putative [Plasmodium ovale wallikeri]SBT35767.1 splicing factor, putative [Plasmodium ovale wallikeri]
MSSALVSEEMASNPNDNEAEEEINAKVFPLASPELTNQILDVIQRATVYKQLKRGANEGRRAYIHKYLHGDGMDLFCHLRSDALTLHKGISELVVLAADAKPLEIISHIPLVCEDKVRCLFLSKRIALIDIVRSIYKSKIERMRIVTRRSRIVSVLFVPVHPFLFVHISYPSQNTPYVYVRSKMALGRACGISRSVIATSIITKDGSPLETQITELKDLIEQMLI